MSNLSEKVLGNPRIATLLIVALTLVKILVFCPVFADRYVFDEGYYLAAARALLFYAGLRNFEPPVIVHVYTVNGTVVFDVSVRDKVGMFAVANLTPQSALNVEHPILAKAIIALALLVNDSVYSARLAASLVAFTAYTIYVYELAKRFGKHAVKMFLALLVFEWIYVHFLYLAVLDTFMLAFMLLSFVYLVRGHENRSVLFASLATASKEYALIYSYVVALLFLAKRRIRTGIKFIAFSTLSLALGYLAYVPLASPELFYERLLHLATAPGIVERSIFLERDLFVWGLFVLFTPLIYFGILLLIIFVLLNWNRDPDIVDALPFACFGAYLAAVPIIALFRAVYPYYYAPAIVMLPAMLPIVIKSWLESVGRADGAQTQETRRG